MTTYGVTDAGFVLKPFSVIRAEVEDYQRQHIDPGLDFSDQSAISQLNVAFCNQVAELWELALAVYSNQYPETASGFSLVQLAALTGTLQNAWSKTTVLGSVTLNPNKNLPAGSVAHLMDRPSARFVTTAEVPADPSGGVFDVLFEAEEPGPIDVVPGLLSVIAEPVSGWTAVTNSVAGTPGSRPETDDELRAKRERELGAAGAANVEAIRADVSAVSGVVDVTVEENVTELWVSGMSPKSVRVTVRGGADADILEALFLSKAAGIDTVGDVSGLVTDSEGTDHLIRFRRASALNFYAKYTIQMRDGYSAEDLQAVKGACSAYVNGLGIGDDVQFDRALCSAYSNPFVLQVDDLRIDFSWPPVGSVNLSVGADEYADSDVANIEVVVV